MSRLSILPKLPDVLWHGSAFHTPVLKPGFLWTKKLVEWDFGESNHYLYATSERDAAIQLGLASAIEKKFRLDRFKSYGKKHFRIESPDEIRRVDLEHLEVFLYEIRPTDKDSWVRNYNAHNGLDTEFKTSATIEYHDCSNVNMQEWLRDADLMFVKS